jgi:hypothetical protein
MRRCAKHDFANDTIRQRSGEPFDQRRIDENGAGVRGAKQAPWPGQLIRMDSKPVDCLSAKTRGQTASTSKKRGARSVKATLRQQQIAMGLVARAKASGELVIGPCEVCGITQRIEAHHDDYEQPLAVRWLCVLHHRRHHGKDVSAGLRRSHAGIRSERQIIGTRLDPVFGLAVALYRADHGLTISATLIKAIRYVLVQEGYLSA